QHVDSEQVVHNYSMAGQTRGGHVANVSPYFLDLRGSRPTLEYLSDNIMTPGWATDADGNLIIAKDDEGNPILVDGDGNGLPSEPNLFIGSGMEQEEYNTAKADSFKI